MVRGWKCQPFWGRKLALLEPAELVFEGFRSGGRVGNLSQHAQAAGGELTR